MISKERGRVKIKVEGQLKPSSKGIVYLRNRGKSKMFSLSLSFILTPIEVVYFVFQITRKRPISINYMCESIFGKLVGKFSVG